MEEGPIRTEKKEVILWQFLLDVLMNPVFAPYIRRTGIALEFVMVDGVVVFTEFFQRKYKQEAPSLNCDPAVRWAHCLVNKIYVKDRIRSFGQVYSPGNARPGTPIIRKTKGIVHGYEFVVNESVQKYLKKIENQHLQVPVETAASAAEVLRASSKRTTSKLTVESARSVLASTIEVEKLPSPVDIEGQFVHLPPISTLFHPASNEFPLDNQPDQPNIDIDHMYNCYLRDMSYENQIPLVPVAQGNQYFLGHVSQEGLIHGVPDPTMLAVCYSGGNEHSSIAHPNMFPCHNIKYSVFDNSPAQSVFSENPLSPYSFSNEYDPSSSYDEFGNYLGFQNN